MELESDSENSEGNKVINETKEHKVQGRNRRQC